MQDLTSWMVKLLEGGTVGEFQAATPFPPTTFESALETVRECVAPGYRACLGRGRLPFRARARRRSAADVARSRIPTGCKKLPMRDSHALTGF